MTFLPEEIFVFLGPSLPLQEAEKILQARYFPPAKQGDLLSLAAQYRPKVIALIDGFFMQTLSVWHMEILFALDQGIHVFGASSMGALRAAETAEFGTIGVGKIYERYKSWELTDDDEVALMHGPAEHGYIPLSLPLINIRFSLEKAKKEGLCTQEIFDEILASASALYYPERTVDEIIKTVQEKGIAEHLVRKCLEENYVDQKKEDALLLLEKVRTFSPENAPPKKSFYQTSLFKTFYHYDRRVCVSTVSLSQRELAHYISLHHADYTEIQFHAFNQALVGMLAKILSIEVTEEMVEEEKQRFCLRNKLLFLTEEDWSEWFSRNDLTPESFHDLMKGRAKTRDLQRKGILGQIPWKPITFLLDELKLRNQYETWAKKAAAQQECLNDIAPQFTENHFAQADTDELLETHLQETDWNPDCAFQKWAEEAGFQDVSELKLEMLKSKLARQAFEKQK